MPDPTPVNPTWGEILQEMRLEIGETTAAFWTDAELMLWFNRAQMEFCRKTEVLETSDTLDIEADLVSFTLPTDYLGMHAATLVDADGNRTFLRVIGDAGRSGNSAMAGDIAYYVTAGTLKLTAEQEAGATLEISYFATPVPFADETETEAEGSIPSTWIGPVTQGALVYAWRKRGEFERMQDCRNEFQAAIIEAKKFRRYKDGARQMTMVV